MRAAQDGCITLRLTTCFIKLVRGRNEVRYDRTVRLLVAGGQRPLQREGVGRRSGVEALYGMHAWL